MFPIRLAAVGVLMTTAFAQAQTSTPWRDDEKNRDLVRKLNIAYERLAFSHDYDGVLDDRPFKLTWSTEPNLPVAWKGGVACIVGDEIVLAGGLWMPGRRNLAYAYTKNRTYREIPPPPFETAYTQGACDGKTAYVVGGRSAGRRVAALSRDGGGAWKWEDLPMLPEKEGKGRWLAVAGIVPGKWLMLVSGHPTGTPSEKRDVDALPGWRLRLDQAGAQWQPMAPYPGGPRALHASAVVRGKLYVFGGSHPDPVMRSIFVDLVKAYKFFETPYGGVPQYRDAYRYDPDADRWERLRNLPFGMSGGAGVVLRDRYILIMGTTETRTHRVGKTDRGGLVKMSAGAPAAPDIEPYWTGYNDVILCYDIETDNYARLGVMMYGVATVPWVTDGKRLYGFGGEPMHRYNDNTENVLQIAEIE
ncbi:MAG: Kelch repeat-containing protein [Bryobacteraceae bacterium]